MVLFHLGVANLVLILWGVFVLFISLQWGDLDENSLTWDLTVGSYLICLKVSSEATCSLLSCSIFHLTHSVLFSMGEERISVWVIGILSKLVWSHIQILVYSWQVFLKASVLYCLFYFTYFNKVHFNMMNLSVHKFKFVSIQQYFSSLNNHEAFLLMILSVSRVL